MESVNEIKKIANKVDGFLSFAEEKFLYESARACKEEGVIVEIGSFKGKSTIWLAKGALAGKKLKIYAVDPHISDLEHTDKKSSFPIFKENLKKASVTQMVTPIVAKSEDAVKKWDKAISFLWIDGDHSYAGAKKDFDLWSPFVIDGAVIAFHDSTIGDVQQVVKHTIFKKGFKKAGLVDSISYATKTKQTNITDFIRSQCVILFSMLHSPVRALVPVNKRSDIKLWLGKVGLPV